MNLKIKNSLFEINLKLLQSHFNYQFIAFDSKIHFF